MLTILSSSFFELLFLIYMLGMESPIEAFSILSLLFLSYYFSCFIYLSWFSTRNSFAYFRTTEVISNFDCPDSMSMDL